MWTEITTTESLWSSSFACKIHCGNHTILLTTEVNNFDTSFDNAFNRKLHLKNYEFHRSPVWRRTEHFNFNNRWIGRNEASSWSKSLVQTPYWRIKVQPNACKNGSLYRTHWTTWYNACIDFFNDFKLSPWLITFWVFLLFWITKNHHFRQFSATVVQIKSLLDRG